MHNFGSQLFTYVIFIEIPTDTYGHLYIKLQAASPAAEGYAIKNGSKNNTRAPKERGKSLIDVSKQNSQSFMR